jgi:hypothetical protein
MKMIQRQPFFGSSSWLMLYCSFWDGFLGNIMEHTLGNGTAWRWNNAFERYLAFEAHKRGLITRDELTKHLSILEYISAIQASKNKAAK